MTVRALRRGSIAASRVTSVPFGSLAVAQLTQAFPTNSASSFATASIAPTANALVCVWVAGVSSSSSATTVTGNGITYNLILVAHPGAFAFGLFAGSAASPSAGAVTINFDASQSGCVYRVEEWTATATPAVRQTKSGFDASGTATSAAITLDAAPQATSATALLLGKSNSATITPGTDFSETLELSRTSPTRMGFHEYDIVPVDAVCDCSWVTAGTWSGIAAEIGAP